jgi:hypothetical protein
MKAKLILSQFDQEATCTLASAIKVSGLQSDYRSAIQEKAPLSTDAPQCTPQAFAHRSPFPVNNKKCGRAGIAKTARRGRKGNATQRALPVMTPVWPIFLSC